MTFDECLCLLKKISLFSFGSSKSFKRNTHKLEDLRLWKKTNATDETVLLELIPLDPLEMVTWQKQNGLLGAWWFQSAHEQR